MTKSVDRTEVAFDHFQRYETIRRLVEFHRRREGQSFRVLELGSNEHKDLKLFLPQDEILFTDIALSEAMEKDPDFQRVDGTAIPFDDKSFDFVVAADVLEHVPAEMREKFLREAWRVSRCGAILSFPFYAQDVMDAEARVNEYYKTLAGEDFIWLKEHLENSLPKTEEISACLNKLGIPFFSLFHGDIRVWEKMWYCHFSTVFEPETLPFRTYIDNYYDRNIYARDVSDSCYRVFCVMAREGVEDWEKYALGLWKKGRGAEDAVRFLEDLIRTQQDLHALSEKNRLNEIILDKERHIADQDRIIEDKARCIQNQSKIIADKDHQLQAQSQAIEEKGRQLQEQGGMLAEAQRRLEKAEQAAEEKARAARTLLARRSAAWEREMDALRAKLTEESARLTEESARLAEESAELACYKEHYLAAINQRNDLEQQLAQVNAAYQSIANATLWKMTKPLRVVLDAIKRPLRRIKFLRLVHKGFKCLRENGARYTWHKLEDKLHHRQDADPPAVTSAHSQEGVGEQRRLALSQDVKFSVIVPLYNTPEHFLREMIQSVIDQTYGNWELCLADGSDDKHGYVETVCGEYARADTRIRYKKLDVNGGISENTNACIEMASGDHLALLDHDDILSRDALEWNAAVIEETAADVLYSDEDHITVDGAHINPLYKPDWSPDLLYSQNYICHLLVFKRELFEKVGGFRPDFDGSQDYDLVLRLSEKTDRICHIPRVLYSWRESETSTAANTQAKPYAHLAGKRALDEHLKRKYGEQAHAEETEHLFVYNARFCDRRPAVSIIIPFKDKWEMTEECVKSILTQSTYSNYEIVLLNNRSEQSATKKWIRRVQRQDKRIRVVDADMEFNWSKLNNFGISQASGDVFVFLNNDTLVISRDWLERLSENAMRPDTGVVGGLLLYQDGSIQHAGVVVGMGGWADHVFKGMQPVHYGSPFVSPLVSRNVLAVTGACMAVSRETIEKIGGFDEAFIICGSDVELGLRAHDNGLFNRYDPHVRLYHLESKSRDAYIPEVDFQKSYEVYGPYRENIDPFFNINLDTGAVVPREMVASMDLVNFKNFLKRCPLTAGAYQKLKRAIMPPQGYSIPEIYPLKTREGAVDVPLRLNLLVPSVDEQHVFGGIATALKFFAALQARFDCPARLIITDAPVCPQTMVKLENYKICDSEKDPDTPMQIIPMNDRSKRTLPVCKGDLFVATGWWTAYVAEEVIRWQSEHFSMKLDPLIYLVQDYEPGFYPWSSRYMLADSTYKLKVPTWAVVNSEELSDYFAKNGYQFERSWVFKPTLNDSLKKRLPEMGSEVEKKKQILVYGRPSTDRNAFELLVNALICWREQQPDAEEWTVLSAGEQHDDIDLGDGVMLRSLGKLSLDEYAQTLTESYAGVSLMVSPHPSYPPLEMAAFGVKTVTNRYANKDLSTFSENIVSLDACGSRDVAKALCDLCAGYSGKGVVQVKREYVLDESGFDSIARGILDSLQIG